MNREYHRWYSSSLRREMELLAFGHAGLPVLVFPTSLGRFFDFENRGMVDAVAQAVEGGRIQLYCIDSVDQESWYNYGAPPRHRVVRHMEYERYVREEALPFIRSRPHAGPLTLTGCSFGAYHAVNLAFRHPALVEGVLSMGGAFDIRQFIMGYYDDDCYFNNPVDYLPNLNDPWYLERFRAMRIVLAAGDRDICLDANRRFSELLHAKGVPHTFDVWGDGTEHDWPGWRSMIRTYLA